MRRICFEFLSGQCRGGTKARGGSHVLCACAFLAFLRASIQERREFCPFADIEGTDALRTINLMCREREQVNTKRVHINWDFSRGLDGIGMKQNLSSLR